MLMKWNEINKPLINPLLGSTGSIGSIRRHDDTADSRGRRTGNLILIHPVCRDLVEVVETAALLRGSERNLARQLKKRAVDEVILVEIVLLVNHILRWDWIWFKGSYVGNTFGLYGYTFD